MIRTLLALVPADRRGRVRLYTVLTVFSVLLRAVGVVLLVPLVAALFSATPADAWPWLGGLTALTVAGWLVDTHAARLGFGKIARTDPEASRAINLAVVEGNGGAPLIWVGEWFA